jgi:hypothetical protein
MTYWCQVGPHVSSAWDEIFLDETCRGNLPWIPQATGYDPTLLDMIGSLQRHMAGQPYTMYQETTLPLPAKKVGPAT